MTGAVQYASHHRHIQYVHVTSTCVVRYKQFCYRCNWRGNWYCVVGSLGPDVSTLTLSCRTTYIYMSYRTANLQMLHFIYYSTNKRTEYFKHAAHTVFFSLKCRLFHNATFFGSCVIHILYTVCAEIKKKFRRQRVLKCIQLYLYYPSTPPLDFHGLL